MEKKRLKNDILLALSVLLTAGALYGLLQACSDQGKWAVIEQDGEVIARMNLDLPQVQRIDSSLGSNVIRTEGGSVWMESADCPDGLCISQGRISSTTGRIVCLPHRLVIRIEGADKALDDMAN